VVRVFARRVARGLGLDRNAMRPLSDRVERWLTATLLITFVVAAPPVGGWAARSVYRSELRQQVWDRQHLRRVPAVLLDDGWVPAGDAGYAADPRQAKASWTAPDGTDRTGTVPVTGRQSAGDRVRIWVDDRGQLSDPPTGAAPRTDATVAATTAVLGLALGLALVRWSVRRVVVGYRLRAWQSAWLEVGPRWTRRR
jgi:hypothetical protein